MFDLVLRVLECVRRDRSEQKRRRFANLVAGQVVKPRDWHEAEIAAMLVDQLSELHVQVILAAAHAPICTKPFEGLRVVGFDNYGDEPEPDKHVNVVLPLLLQEALPDTNLATIRLICADLVAKGLLHDEGVGRIDTGAMEYFVLSDSGRFFLDWVAEPDD